MQAKDLIGKKIGKWNVLDYARIKNGQKYFRCSCECGNTKEVSYSNLSIDRIDNNKGYSPENCRWVDRKTQARNTRQNRFIVFNGERKCLAEWEEVLKLPKGLITNRLRRGYSEIEAITVPVQTKSSRGYLRLKKIKDMILFFSCLAMCSCSHKNLNGIPCEALNLIYYEEIYPLEAEIEVLKNNAVIEEICR